MAAICGQGEHCLADHFDTLAELKIRIESWLFKVGTILQSIIGFPIGNIQ